MAAVRRRCSIGYYGLNTVVRCVDDESPLSGKVDGADRERYAPSSDDVVRHRCNNRLCINPDHLEFGDRAANRNDELARRAAGNDLHRLGL